MSVNNPTHRNFLALGHGMNELTNDRNAPSSSSRPGGANGKWKHTPTPIPQPGSSKIYTTNPLAPSRMRSNLDEPKSRLWGNATAKRTVLQSDKTPWANRRKGAATPNLSGARSKDPYSRPSEDAVDVDIDDEEDTGEPLTRAASTSRQDIGVKHGRRTSSPDPIDVIPGQPSSSRQAESSAIGSRYRLARDGTNTKALATKLNSKKPRVSATDDKPQEKEIHHIEDSDSDPIEVDDEPPRNLPSPQLRPKRVTGQNVASKINIYEPRPPLEMRLETVAPHIDLIARKKAMKTRDGLPRKPLDIEPSKSGTAVGSSKLVDRRKVKKTTPRTIALPLKAWALGVDLFQPPDGGKEYWLCSDLTKVEVKGSAEAPCAIFDFIPRDFVSSVEHSMHPCNLEHPVIIRFKTVKAAKRQPKFNREGLFKHKSQGMDGYITFSFTTDHANWGEGESYKQLVDWLDETVAEKEFFNGAGSQSVWDAFVQGILIAKRTKAAETSREVQSVSAAPQKQAKPVDGTLEASGFTSYPARATRSTRRSLNKDAPAPKSSIPDDELILVYPPSGTGAVNITGADIKRLEPGQYLNDTLIEFALKHWLNELREQDPGLAEQIHIFSSFFYKKLQVKNKDEGYQSVRKWTSKLDLFKKKYIVVPINEHLHWYLAIICNPEFILQPSATVEPVITAPQTRKRKRDSEADLEALTPRSSPGPESCPTEVNVVDAVDEGSVEALLGGCTLKPGSEGEDSPPQLQYPQDSIQAELQYPSSDLMELDHIPPPSTEPGTPSISDDQAMQNGESSSEIQEVGRSMDVDDSKSSKSSSKPSSAVTTVDRPIVASRFWSASTVRKLHPRDSTIIPDSDVEMDGEDEDVKGKESKENKKEQEQEVQAEHEQSNEFPASTEIPDQDKETIKVSDVATSSGSPGNQAYIFTFDSLGTTHPAASRNLSLYLRMEANDKKGLALQQTSEATYVAARVPAQPNFCDCGVYLIHFVKTFMKDPVKMSEKILAYRKTKSYDSKEREKDWDADTVGNLRDVLLATTMSLSEEWKKEKAAKDEQKRRDKESTTEANTPAGGSAEPELVPDSDDEIIVGEVVKKAPISRGAKGKQPAGKNDDDKPRSTAALRLR